MSAAYDWNNQPDPDDDLDTPEHQRQTLLARRSKDGAAFILDAPDEIPAIWGHGQEVLWAKGESLLIAGPPGVGKTTLASQVIRARLGIGGPVLGLPIEKGTRKVLYLAMDRPAQIARALRRSFTEYDRATLQEQLTVWKGPPPTDFAKNPTELIGLAQTFDADTVIIDSLKDAFLGLSNDEEAAGYNRARQFALAEGVELIELHHQVKRGAAGGKPNTLADVYGSAWITAGAGSVVLLYGEAGDPVVDFRHLKQPAAEVGPWQVIHDHLRGTTEIFHGADLLQLATASRATGLDVKTAACAMWDTDKPTTNQIEKARRRLKALTRAGQLIEVDSGRTGTPAVYLRAAIQAVTPLDTLSDSSGHGGSRKGPEGHGLSTKQGSRLPETETGSRSHAEVTAEDKTAGQKGHGKGHGGHAAEGHGSAPLTGGAEPDREAIDQLTEEQIDQIAGVPCPDCEARAGHTTNCPNQPEPNGWN